MRTRTKLNVLLASTSLVLLFGSLINIGSHSESTFWTTPSTVIRSFASDKTKEKIEVRAGVLNFKENQVPVSIVSRAHTARKTDCEKDRFLVWQGHTSGLGSNMVIGATHALTFAAYTNRSFVLGLPHQGFPYTNPNRNANVKFSWNKVLDMRKSIFSPCAENFSEIPLSLSSQEEILENKKRVLVLNFDNGPGGVGWWHNMLMDNNISYAKPFGYYQHDASSEIIKMFGTLSQETVTACLLREVLIYQRFGIRRSLRTSLKYVGVHARGGDKVSELKLEDENLFMDALHEIKGTHADITSVYLSGDRLSLRKAIMQTFDNVYFLPEIPSNPSEINTRECRFPCLFYDVLFDTLMLARGEILLGTIGSGLSMMSILLQQISFGSGDSFSWHVGQEHPGLQKYVMQQRQNYVRDSYFWDPRKDMGIEAGIVLLEASNAKKGVKLLSIHPWAFLVFEETGIGAEAPTMASIRNCVLSSSTQSMYVTPGIFVSDLNVNNANELTRECHDRPLRILVASDQRHHKNHHGNAEMKVVRTDNLDKLVSQSFDVTLDVATIRLTSFISLLQLFQSNFGLPDITEDIYILQRFLEGLDTDER